jgi:tetratricopeptide (TPR) repeat protein
VGLTRKDSEGANCIGFCTQPRRSDNAATAAQAIPILESAKSASVDGDEKLSIDIALLNAYSHAEKYDNLYALASEIAKSYPESKHVFSFRETALRRLARFGEADQLVQEMSKRLPDYVEIQREFISNAVMREDYKSAHQLGDQLVTSGEAEASDLNGLAWNVLFFGTPGKEDLDAATRSVQMAPGNFGSLDTLSCVYAAMGKTKEAREVLIQAMDALKLDEPEDNSWYALGRIAEQYGETAVGSADYRHVNKPKKAVEIPGSSYRLAQLRLAAQPH